MPMICYQHHEFRGEASDQLALCRQVVDEYREQGYQLTLRQLYYQFVARGRIENTLHSYKRLGDLVSDGRLAGVLDWTSIEDRTRNVRLNAHWSSPREILRSVAAQYAIDKWRGQGTYLEVWIEKEALFGVIDRPCSALDVPRFACRGYVSQSEMWAAEQRIRTACSLESGAPRVATIIHLGDHDPSGIDMTRDIETRLNLFAGAGNSGEIPFEVSVERIALNMNQVLQYSPPPNPAKITDSRAEAYIARFGAESWELDALEPAVIDRLVREAVTRNLDMPLWETARAEELAARRTLQRVADKWNKVRKFLETAAGE